MAEFSGHGINDQLAVMQVCDRVEFPEDPIDGVGFWAPWSLGRLSSRDWGIFLYFILLSTSNDVLFIFG